MIDFGCREFDLDDIMKCGLGLTKAEFRVMRYLVQHPEELTTSEIAEKIGLDITTIQKAVKKLADKGVVSRSQKNLEGGGYMYLYRSNPRTEIREVLKGIIKKWSSAVEDRIDEW